METQDNLPRGYVLFVEIKFAEDMKDPIRYYVGMPMAKNKADLKWVYSMSRKHALIFKDNILIGKFLSKYYKELKNISKGKTDGIIYIQDVDSEHLICDTVEISRFQPF